jgi:hypothetical protein
MKNTFYSLLGAAVLRQMSPSRWVTISHNIAAVTKQKCAMMVQLLMNGLVFVVFWYHAAPDIPSL